MRLLSSSFLAAVALVHAPITIVAVGGCGSDSHARQLPPLEVVSQRPTADADEAATRTIVAELTGRATDDKEPKRPDPRKAIADLVVLISVDGLRPDVIFPEAPTIHRLQLDGAAALHSRTISKSSTLPSHASMVSGVDFDQHGLTFNSYRPERGHIQYPTIFSEAQRSGLSTALFVGKRKLEHLLRPEFVDHLEVGGVFCNKVTDLAIPHLRNAVPGVVFIHFSDPDGAGHQYGWMSGKYKDAVHRADRCVRDVLEALEARGDMDRTLVLVTSDHGGHDHNHGTRKRLDRMIPWVLYGAGVKIKKRIRRTVFNTDTAATIFFALGIEPPDTIVGKPVLEAFEGHEA